MAHTKVILEALLAESLGQLVGRFQHQGSELRRWLDEVSTPPPEVEVQGRRQYSGLFYVIRNRIKRAFVVEHRAPEPTDVHPRPRDYFGEYPSSQEELDDEFPNFG